MSSSPDPTVPSTDPTDGSGAGAPRFDEVVDLGSWAAFEPSLAALLDGEARPHAPWPGLTILLTAPRPVVTAAELKERMGLRSLLRGRRGGGPSPEVPGLVLVGRGDGVQVSVPVLDAEGCHLLGPDARQTLRRLGWADHQDLLVRVLADGAEAAQAVTRVLIETLHVPHPADVDHLVVLTG